LARNYASQNSSHEALQVANFCQPVVFHRPLIARDAAQTEPLIKVKTTPLLASKI
jgi:hypothetical protein